MKDIHHDVRVFSLIKLFPVVACHPLAEFANSRIPEWPERELRCLYWLNGLKGVDADSTVVTSRDGRTNNGLMIISRDSCDDFVQNCVTPCRFLDNLSHQGLSFDLFSREVVEVTDDEDFSSICSSDDIHSVNDVVDDALLVRGSRWGVNNTNINTFVERYSG